MKLILRVALLVLTTISVPALSFAGGSITSGSATMQFVGNPIFATPFGDVNLSFPGVADQQQRYTWYYRTPVGGNRIFSALDTPVESYVGNTATVSYTNAGPGTSGLARFNTTFTIVLTSPAPGLAVVTTTVVFSAAATNTAAQTFHLFSMIAFDLGPTGPNGVADVYRVTEPSTVAGTITDGANYVQWRGDAADRYELNLGSTLNTKLNGLSGDLTNLAGTTSADVISAAGGAAVQFTRTLAPGQSTTITTAYSVNMPIPEPSSWALLVFGAAAAAAVQRQRLRGRRASH